MEEELKELLSNISPANKGEKESELQTVFQVCEQLANSMSIFPNSNIEAQDELLSNEKIDPLITGSCSQKEMAIFLQKGLELKGIDCKLLDGNIGSKDYLCNEIRIAGDSYAIDLATYKRNIIEVGGMRADFLQEPSEFYEKFGIAKMTSFEELAKRFSIDPESLRRADKQITDIGHRLEDKEKGEIEH